MTTNKDFKRLVRARMAKTGETYTAARAQLASAPAPSPDEYAEMAEISEQSVMDKTGKSWAQWLKELDAINALALNHTQIAAQIRERWPEIGPWWAQSVTVSYERIRGLRQKGQLCSGDFAASKSKTFPVHISALWSAIEDSQARAEWMGEPTTLRTAQEGRSMRLNWPDGSRVMLHLSDKGPQKCTLAVQHQKLASAAQRDQQKAAWGERLKVLAELLKDQP